LQAIATPVMLVWGDRDPYFPLEVVQELHTHLPNSRLWTTPGQGHCPVWINMGGDSLAAQVFPQRVTEFFPPTGH